MYDCLSKTIQVGGICNITWGHSRSALNSSTGNPCLELEFERQRMEVDRRGESKSVNGRVHPFASGRNAQSTKAVVMNSDLRPICQVCPSKGLQK